jgi:hypothetical protein
METQLNVKGRLTDGIASYSFLVQDTSGSYFALKGGSKNRRDSDGPNEFCFGDSSIFIVAPECYSHEMAKLRQFQIKEISAVRPAELIGKIILYHGNKQFETSANEVSITHYEQGNNLRNIILKEGKNYDRLIDVVHLLEDMHQKGEYHGDFNLTNVLVVNNCIKCCDLETKLNQNAMSWESMMARDLRILTGSILGLTKDVELVRMVLKSYSIDIAKRFLQHQVENVQNPEMLGEMEKKGYMDFKLLKEVVMNG